LKIERRQFVLGLGGLMLLPSCKTPPAAGADAGVPGDSPPEALTLQSFGQGAARVVEARWAAAVSPSGVVKGEAVATMIDAAMAELTGSSRSFSEWAGASRRISIKVNTITSQAFTHPEVASAVARRVVDSGSNASRVTVWDRDGFGLVNRGYALDPTGAGGYRCLGSDTEGNGAYSPVHVAGERVLLSPLLIESDVLFSIAALKDHSMAGVSLSLKNNFGMLHSAELLHGNISKGAACEPGISELAALPEIKGRLGLALLDGLIGVCEGGPGPALPQHVFRYGGILVSRDPVALDRRGLTIIEARRARLGLEPLAQRTSPNPSPPSHIENAAARGVSPG
jgi:uncharacterized protein (DUF362 family)